MSKKDNRTTIKNADSELLQMLPQFEVKGWEQRRDNRGSEVLYIRMRRTIAPVKLAVA